MMKKIQISTQDKHIIHGTLDSQGTTDSVIIFAHGLTGNQHEHHYFNAVPFFNKLNIDTFRFDFYSKEEKGRHLEDCTLTIHAEDINTVIKYLSPNYKKVYLVGHSLGVLAILKSNLTQIDKLILWDPSGGFNSPKEKGLVWINALDKYLLDWQMQILINKKLVREWKNFDIQTHLTKVVIPTKFIFAGDLRKYNQWYPYIQKIKAPNTYKIIKNSTHCFVEPNTSQELYQETYKWIDESK